MAGRFVLRKLQGKVARVLPRCSLHRLQLCHRLHTHPDLHAERSAFINKATELPARGPNCPQLTAVPPPDETSGAEDPGRRKKGGKAINPAGLKVWRPGFLQRKYFHVGDPGGVLQGLGSHICSQNGAENKNII